MNATESLTRRPGLGSPEPAGDDRQVVEAQGPTVGGIVDQLVPLVDVVVVAGPPVSFVAGPWLLLCLMLSAPFAVLIALAAVWVLAALLLATLAGVCAAPYLLVRGLHRRYRRPRAVALPRTNSARIASRGVVA